MQAIQMIRTEELVKIYTTEEIETTALNHVSIEIREGETTVVEDYDLAEAE